MTWKNALIDGIPDDEKEVVVCVNGINYRAKYNASEHSFFLEDDQTLVDIEAHASIYWTEIENPVCEN